MRLVCSASQESAEPTHLTGGCALHPPWICTVQSAVLALSAASILWCAVHAAAISASASVCRAARPARVLSARTVLTPWAQYMVVLVLQFIWRQRGSKPRGSGLRVSTTRRRSRHLRALKVRLRSLELPPARALKSCPAVAGRSWPGRCVRCGGRMTPPSRARW